MKRIFYLIACVALMTSCAEQYSIKGTSTLSVLDGSKLYLKVLKGTEMTILDSCEVVHGQFRFSGLLDTTYMASLYLGERSVMPLVVEKGDIQIRIEEAQQRVSGSPMNELLYDFLDRHNQLESQMMELPHRESRMLLDGINEDEINDLLSAEAAMLAQQEDSLVYEFVVANFDNVLGPFVFVQMASSVPQVEHVMSVAPDAFKNHPAVSKFYRHVTEMTAPAGQGGMALSEDTNASEIDDAMIQDILNGNGDNH